MLSTNHNKNFSKLNKLLPSLSSDMKVLICPSLQWCEHWRVTINVFTVWAFHQVGVWHLPIDGNWTSWICRRYNAAAGCSCRHNIQNMQNSGHFQRREIVLLCCVVMVRYGWSWLSSNQFHTTSWILNRACIWKRSSVHKSSWCSWIQLLWRKGILSC